MQPEGLTYISPLGLYFTLFMGLLTLLLPRKYALIPIIVTAALVTLGQRIVVLTLDFTMMRILVLFGWLRLFLHQEFGTVKFNSIDKAIIIFTVSGVVVYTLLWQTNEAFINRLGFAFNSIGMFFLFRYLIRSIDDIVVICKTLAIVAIPLSGAMLIEQMTARNVFAIFGGVPEYTAVRMGRLRAQGPFAHPILAGTFGASLIPFIIALKHKKGSILLVTAGFIAATIITFTASSSGPAGAYLIGLTGFFMWTFRKNMQVIRWGIITTVLGLHLVMSAPVWFLIARVNIVPGSTGYHRSFLIDRAIAHLGEWWQLGTKSTDHWGPGLFDITNFYIRIGIEGGLLTMGLFIYMIVLCFKGLGQSIRIVGDGRPVEQKVFWALGVALLVHMVSFISVSYFDQNILFWYLLLASIATVTEKARQMSQPDGPAARKGFRTS